MKPIEEHTDELKAAPLLSSLEKKNIFQVPMGYFDALPGRRREGDPSEGKPNASLLSQVKKESVFQAPAGYFDQLPKRIREQTLPEIAATNSRPRWLTPTAAWSWAIAAAIAVLLLVGFWQKLLLKHPDHDSELRLEQQWASLSDDALLAAVEEESYQLDMILDLMEENDVDPLADDWEVDLTEAELDQLLEEVDLEELESSLDLGEGILSE